MNLTLKVALPGLSRYYWVTRHSLSDPALEEALRVRLDFMWFTGFEIEDDTPDETTVCRFKNNIIHKRLHERLFREINRQLEKHGIKVKEAEGALLDTTIVTSAACPKKTVEPDHAVKQSADPDASWVKKGKQSYFGY